MSMRITPTHSTNFKAALASRIAFWKGRKMIPPTARKLIDEYCERNNIDPKADGGLLETLPYLAPVLQDTPFELWPAFLYERPTMVVEGNQIKITELGSKIAASEDTPLEGQDLEDANQMAALEEAITKELS